MESSRSEKKKASCRQRELKSSNDHPKTPIPTPLYTRPPISALAARTRPRHAQASEQNEVTISMDNADLEEEERKKWKREEGVGILTKCVLFG